MVYDCQPPLLPVSLEMSDIGPLSVRTTVVAANVAVPPWEEGPTISGVGSDVVGFPGLGVAPLVDSGMDLEDELSTPDGSPSTDAVKPGEIFRRFVLFVLRLGACTVCGRAGPCVGICGRTGPCVTVFSPSGGGRKSGSG